MWRAKPRDANCHAQNRGKGIVSIKPFDIRFRWSLSISGWILSRLARPRARKRERGITWMNVELRFERVGSRRRTSAGVSLRKRRSGSRTRVHSHRYHGFAVARDPRADDLISHRNREDVPFGYCHPPSHLSLERPLIMPHVNRYRSMAHLNRSKEDMNHIEDMTFRKRTWQLFVCYVI